MTNEELKKFALDWFNNEGITEPTDEDIIQLYTDLNGKNLGWCVERLTDCKEEEGSFVQTMVSDNFGIIVVNHDLNVYFNNPEEVADYLASINDDAALLQTRLNAVATLADFGSTYAHDVYENDTEDDADGAQERANAADKIINAAALVTVVK